MLVDLRQPPGELVEAVVDRVREGQLHQRLVGEELRDLLAEALVQPVVVVHVQEPTPLQMFA